MPILLFDIDGTLVRTNGAGKTAMESALREEFGIPEIKDVVPYGGRTDPAIGHDLLTVHDCVVTKENISHLTQQYLNRLPAALDRHGGVVCPGIREILAALHPRDDIHLGLLTGNVRAGAQTKLGYFGLWDYFRFGGFGDGHTDRDDVARSALAAVTNHVGNTKPSDVWVIGDTPLDVSCGRAIGATVIAVATGWVSLDDLKRCEPDHAYDDLSDVNELLRLWS